MIEYDEQENDKIENLKKLNTEPHLAKPNFLCTPITIYSARGGNKVWKPNPRIIVDRPLNKALCSDSQKPVLIKDYRRYYL
ncbi:MAG: hypothetical protein R2788_26390 [Saprospiraceae bacterium]